MDKIAVVGDYDSIYGFASLGLDTFPVKGEEAHDTVLKLAEGDYGIIYITEAVAESIPTVIEHYKEQLKPAIILIPGIAGNTGRGVSNDKKSVEQAVGADILFADEK